MGMKRKKKSRNNSSRKESVKHGDVRRGNFFTGGMIVYGAGEHLTDMLAWHDDLAGRIVRLVDKDPTKIGKRFRGLPVKWSLLKC